MDVFHFLRFFDFFNNVLLFSGYKSCTFLTQYLFYTFHRRISTEPDDLVSWKIRKILNCYPLSLEYRKHFFLFVTDILAPLWEKICRKGLTFNCWRIRVLWFTQHAQLTPSTVKELSLNSSVAMDQALCFNLFFYKDVPQFEDIEQGKFK